MPEGGKKKASKKASTGSKKSPGKKAPAASKKATPSKKPTVKRSAAPKPPREEAPKPKEDTPSPSPSLPQFVKDASPAERKAAVEQLAQDAGIAPILARAPWRRKSEDAGDSAASEGVRTPRKKREMPQPASPDADAASNVGVRGAKPVILDTNALMMQFQFHIDVEKELSRLLEFKHEIIVPSIVVDELKALAEETLGKDAGEARMALQLAQTFKVVDAPGAGDTGILRLAEKLNALVVTNDKILRARLRAKDVPNIYMRKSAFLTLEGHVSGV